MNGVNKRLVVLAILLPILAAALIVVKIITRPADVAIDFNVPDISNLSATLDGQSFAITGVKGVYHIKAGSHELAVRKLNYKPVSIDFAATRGQQLILNVSLQRTNNNTLGSWQQVAGVNSTSTTSINNIEYFYQQSWAVAHIIDNTTGDAGVVVLRYDDPSNSWRLALGPGTSFSSSSLKQLPSQVASYMQANFSPEGQQ